MWPPLPTDPYPPPPSNPYPYEPHEMPSWDAHFGCPFCDEGIGFAQALEEEPVKQQVEEDSVTEQEEVNQLLELWYTIPPLSKPMKKKGKMRWRR